LKNNHNHPEQAYLDLLSEVLKNGQDRPDRTGVGTKSIFGPQLKFDLSQGFPAVTTKKLAWRSMLSELLWMIEGSGDEYRLREILHGDRYSEKTTIWTENSQAEYWTKRRQQRHPGDLGRIYGVQWRRWRKPLIRVNKVVLQNHDQLLELIDGIKTDPYSRRHILMSYNPGEIDLMALPPCHMMCQFYVSTDNKLSCHMYQRSADLGLGVPYNIASYALLTHMIAQVCELTVGDLIMSFGDAHIYQDQIEHLKIQLTKKPYPAPTLWLDPEIKSITDFTMDSAKLIDYQHHPAIIMKMAV